MHENSRRTLIPRWSRGSGGHLGAAERVDQTFPYNSREGGYQYIYGGPYDAETELRENFEGIVSDDVILKAVDKVQSEGIFDWAPSGRHPDQVAVAEEAAAEDWHNGGYTFEDLKSISVGSEAPGLGSTQERAKRTEVLEKLTELEVRFPSPGEHGGIGHNNPPDEFAIADADILVIRKDLEEVKTELSKDTPDVPKVAEKASNLSKFTGWMGDKFDKTIDEFCKSFGSTLGKTMGVALPASLLASPYWGKFVELLVSLKDWLLLALGVG